LSEMVFRLMCKVFSFTVIRLQTVENCRTYL